MERPLSDLEPMTQGYYISRVAGQSDMGRRLTELGLVPGTAICCELVSPGGDPMAYRVRGTLLALRRRDAGLVWVREGQV